MPLLFWCIISFRVQTSETVQGKPSHATLKEEYETLTHKLHCGLHKQIKSYTSRNVKLLTSKIFQVHKITACA